MSPPWGLIRRIRRDPSLSPVLHAEAAECERSWIAESVRRRYRHVRRVWGVRCLD